MKEAYIQGFIDGFNTSAEGYNGEYVDRSLRGEKYDIHLREEAEKSWEALKANKDDISKQLQA